MDPDRILSETREAAQDAFENSFRYDEWELARRLNSLAESVATLDDWLSKGGLMPKAWDVGRAAQVSTDSDVSANLIAEATPEYRSPRPMRSATPALPAETDVAASDHALDR